MDLGERREHNGSGWNLRDDGSSGVEQCAGRESGGGELGGRLGKLLDFWRLRSEQRMVQRFVEIQRRTVDMGERIEHNERGRSLRHGGNRGPGEFSGSTMGGQ